MLLKRPDFPRTYFDPFLRTSDNTPLYNCLAWAAGDKTKWYWPDPNFVFYWPPNIPRQETIEALVKLYESLGYKKCPDGGFEPGYIKVAVFAKNGAPTHAARQLNEAWWTSKLGRDVDVSHSIYSIEEGTYGKVVQYLKKPN